eukprot:TRINITY_DN2582_c0_g1_i10.p4 TRINITY_DN2582_c0_g1~~TRINITY_DN2582_c0_g1_i10.p4  ORF type:complete len:213 (+),score=32.49 TRINITY_DN2582_c0_g1_i10:1413-2051(+)
MLNVARLDICSSQRRKNQLRWQNLVDGVCDQFAEKGEQVKSSVREYFMQSPQNGAIQESVSLNYSRNKFICARTSKFAAILPGDSAVELVLVNGLNNFLNLYNAALIGRILLTWFPNPPAAIAAPLATICDPYLNLFRGIIPPIGGTIDLSPILAFVVLNFFQSSAAALPCELPSEKLTKQQGARESVSQFIDPSKAQKAWDKRFGETKQQD